MPNLDKVYEAFFEPGEVVEIRALDVVQRTSSVFSGATLAGVVTGYFDNAADFGKAAEALVALSPAPKGIYFTPNPCKPDLLARAANRLVAAGKNRPLTSDHDIAVIRWFLVDLDPKRVAGVSSSMQELTRAKERGITLREFLQEQGFGQPIKAMSGNGWHLNYRLPDLPNEPEVSGKQKGLIAKSLAALASKFTDKDVDVDVTVGNAARIWKIYGTWARKGDSTEARPHRMSYLTPDSPALLRDVPVNPREVLEKLAAMAPPEPGKGQQREQPTEAKAAKPSLPQSGGLGALDIERYLAHYGVAVKGTKVDGAATFYLLEKCLFDATHTTGKPAVVVSPEPPFLTYACFEASCAGRTWKEARELISGDKSVAEFCAGYDPNWKPPVKAKKQESPPKPLRDRSGADQPPPDPTGVAGDGYEVERIDFFNAPTVPPPGEIEPIEFFDLGPNGTRKRGVFVEMRMAQYLKLYLDPIVHTAKRFYVYRCGVWREIEVTAIDSVIVHTLGEMCKAQFLDVSVRVLAGLVNQEPHEWPEYPNLINCKNGMVNLDAEYMAFRGVGEPVLLPHDKKYGSRMQLPVDYTPEAECPRWMLFLSEIFPEYQDRANLLQLFAGYVLMPHTKYEKALFMFGTGANGKSTVITIMEKILGQENVCTVSLADLSRPFSVLALQNKMLSVASEMETRDPANTETLKKVISGDSISGEEKFGKRIEFKSPVKFMFAMNNPPSVTDKTDGFKRKILVLNFDQRIPDNKMDRGLVDYLIDNEAAGIFAWMVMGSAILKLKKGFNDLGEIVEKDTSSFMHNLNPLLDFLDEKTILEKEAQITCVEFYQAYRSWAEEGGLRPMGRQQLNIQLLASRPTVNRKRIVIPVGGTEMRPNFYTGIRLLI